MATPGYAEALLGGLPQDVKRALTELVRYMLPNGRFGPVDHQTKAESFQAYYVNSTTSSTANDEFTVQHGLGRTPYLVVPVLPLDVVGAKTVRLEVSRAADGQRIYLKSPEASAPVSLLVE